MRAALLLFAAVSLFAQPKRIVSTAPSITEMLYELGLGDRVAGVTRFCHYPPEAMKKPKIGDYVRPDIEAIAALRPDLVIIQSNPVRLSEKLASLRLRVLEINHDRIEGIFTSIKQIGDAAGTAGAAAKLNDRIRGDLDRIRSRFVNAPKRRVMFVVGRSPNRLDGLVVVGSASYLNEVMKLAGGENVFEDAVAPYPAISLESVIARNPDVIIDMGDMAQTVGVTDAHKRDIVALWSRFANLRAVKDKRVFAVASDIYVVPGPRVVDAALAFAGMFHPEAAP